MLVEGIDDSVIYLSTIIIILLVFVMFNFLKNNVLSVQQLNPQIHSDSREQVNRVREEMQANLEQQHQPATDSTSDTAVQQRIRRRGGNHGSINCPICLTNANFPIETNCGHIFCAPCIIQYWQHLTSNLSKMKCPMCRQDVSCLLPLYSRAETQNQNDEDLNRVFAAIQSYNRRFSGAPRNYWDYISDIPILLRHVVNELFSFNDLNIWYRIRFGFLLFVSFIYFISPLDFIPEAIFGLFGLLDDLFVVFFLIIYVCTLYRQVIANRS